MDTYIKSGMRLFTTGLIRYLVIEGTHVAGSYDEMEKNPVGKMLIKELSDAEGVSVDAIRQYLKAEDNKN